MYGVISFRKDLLNSIFELVTMASSEDLFLNRAKFVMKFLGVWVPVENGSVFHAGYRAFMMTLQYLFLIFQIIYIIQVWGDLDAVSQASYLLFTQACLCLKVTVFQKNMGMLKELLKRMDSKVFRPENVTHEKYDLEIKLPECTNSLCRGLGNRSSYISHACAEMH